MESNLDYQMEHKPTKTGGLASDITNGGDLIPKDFYTNPEWYADMDDSSYKQSFRAIKGAHGNPDAEVTIYRAGVNGELNNGDWVTLSKDYAMQHSEYANGEVQVNEFKVAAKHLHFAGDDINEFGYFAPPEQVIEDNKTLAVIHSIKEFEDLKELQDYINNDYQLGVVEVFKNIESDIDFMGVNNTGQSIEINCGEVNVVIGAYGETIITVEGEDCNLYYDTQEESIQAVKNIFFLEHIQEINNDVNEKGKIVAAPVDMEAVANQSWGLGE